MNIYTLFENLYLYFSLVVWVKHLCFCHLLYTCISLWSWEKRANWFVECLLLFCW